LNKVFFDRKDDERPDVKMYEALLALKDELINENTSFVGSSENKLVFPHYQNLPETELKRRIAYYYYMIETAVHYGSRRQILALIPNMARARFLEGIELSEIIDFVQYIGRSIITKLAGQNELIKIRQRIESEITMTVQIICDEMEDVFERLTADHPCSECREAGISLCTHETALIPLSAG
jgi:hypothetical protein